MQFFYRTIAALSSCGIANIWKADTARANAVDRRSFPVMPDGRSDIVIVFDSATLQTVTAMHTGFDRSATAVHLPEEAVFVGVQCTPASNRGAREIASSDRLLATFVPWVRSLLGPVPAAIPSGLGRVLRAGFDPLVEHVDAGLRRTPSRDHIAALAQSADASLRTVERRFLACSGLRPSDMVRIYRFVKFSRLGAASDRLSDTAYRLGYADQAHMCREVKRLSGMTPEQFRRRVSA